MEDDRKLAFWLTRWDLSSVNFFFARALVWKEIWFCRIKGVLLYCTGGKMLFLARQEFDDTLKPVLLLDRRCFHDHHSVAEIYLRAEYFIQWSQLC